MCGIVAVYNYRRSPVGLDREQIRRISDRMICRGPDGAGEWQGPDGDVALAHRRLAIIDLTNGGAQPMTDAAGCCVLSFNGEIYNYRSLRAELEAQGRRFRSGSDTEVLLQLYLQRGEAMVNDLRGMFAFALWDGRRRELLLARDPFGMKPLYFADDGSSVRIASEVKALLAGGDIDTRPEPAGRVGFLLWGHVPEPYTLFRGIRSVRAGSTLRFGPGGQGDERKYADLGEMLSDAEREPVHLRRGEAAEYLRAACVDTVSHHLIADVDVGIFLSAGIDSGSLTALASETSGRLRTCTLGFHEYRGTIADETMLAEAVSEEYGTEHQTVWITKDDFQRETARLLDRMDQPTIDGVNSYFVAKAAAETGLKVALSGLGGDEILSGYPSFTQIPRVVKAVRRIPKPVGKAFRHVAAPLLKQLERRLAPKYAGLLEYGGDHAGAYLLRRGLYMPWELPTILDPDMVRDGWRELAVLPRLRATSAPLRSDRLKISALEASWYMRNQLLRDTDWASMSHGLEVRVPFVDWTFWRSLARLAAGCSAANKQALASLPRHPLPAAVWHRPKTGFSIPTRQWLSEKHGHSYGGRGLRGWARFVLSQWG